MKEDNKSAVLRVDSRGLYYITDPGGQTRRADSAGIPVSRVRMSKKERLKYRRECQAENNREQISSRNKVLETPVVNPLTKPEEESLNA